MILNSVVLEIASLYAIHNPRSLTGLLAASLRQNSAIYSFFQPRLDLLIGELPTWSWLEKFPKVDSCDHVPPGWKLTPRRSLKQTSWRTMRFKFISDGAILWLTRLSKPLVLEPTFWTQSKSKEHFPLPLSSTHLRTQRHYKKGTQHSATTIPTPSGCLQISCSEYGLSFP